MDVSRFDLRGELSRATSPPGRVVSLDTTNEPDPFSIELPEGMRYEHIFRYVATAAWALQPEVLAALKTIVRNRMLGVRLTDDEIEVAIGAPVSQRKAEAAARRGNAVRRHGAVGLMSLYGIVAPRASMVNNLSGPSGTGLDAFSKQFRALLDDPEVTSIVIDVNSPGGSADMVPETAALIRAGRDRKPVYAVANTDIGSAAYWLASQASEVSATPSGFVGSIGVYVAHQDISAMQEMEGVKTTLISAGKYKTEFNPFEALGEEARASVQEMVDGYYDWFVNDVARGRVVDAKTVRSGFGEGRMVSAKAALAEGMIDRIETLEQTVERAMNGGRAPSSSSTSATSSADDVTVTAAEPDGPSGHFEYVDL